jgi:AbiJ N-terminal domain 4
MEGNMFNKLSKRAQEVIALSAKNSQPPRQNEALSPKLKNQILFIWNDIAKSFIEVVMNQDLGVVFRHVRARLQEELGLPQLVSYQLPAFDDVATFFMQEQDTDKCLNIITIVLHSFGELTKGGMDNRWDERRAIANAVSKMNERFRENNIPYEFREGSFIRIAAGFVHDEMTVPAFELLKEPCLKLANQEFAKAHDDFRLCRYSDCINECLKAFESTMKSICDKRKWPYDQNATATPLVAICEQNNLFPTYLQNQIGALRTLLQSGVPTVRNKNSGHGQGVVPNNISEDLARYALNMTASNIIFLVSCEKAMK